MINAWVIVNANSSLDMIQHRINISVDMCPFRQHVCCGVQLHTLHTIVHHPTQMQLQMHRCTLSSTHPQHHTGYANWVKPHQ